MLHKGDILKMNRITKTILVGVVSLFSLNLHASDSSKGAFWDEGSIPYRFVQKKNSNGNTISNRNEFRKYASLKNKQIKNESETNPFIKVYVKYDLASSIKLRDYISNPFNGRKLFYNPDSMKELRDYMSNPFNSVKLSYNLNSAKELRYYMSNPFNSVRLSYNLNSAKELRDYMETVSSKRQNSY